MLKTAIVKATLTVNFQRKITDKMGNNALTKSVTANKDQVAFLTLECSTH